MTDKELLELAAKAAGYTLEELYDVNGYYWPWCFEIADQWNPLTSDSDALRLAVKLKFVIEHWDDCVDVGYFAFPRQKEMYGGDPYAATRRAIVRAAAQIGGTL